MTLAVGGFTACNSEVEVKTVLPSSAVVRTFSLAPDSKILPHLDSVFFSIDLYTGEIYNADSLPYGTRTSKLIPVILTDDAQIVELSVPRPGNVDSVYNYLENTTDSVDFSNGPVKIRVVSYDGKTERNYSVRVNVHTVPTDTMVWERLEKGNLPTTLNAVTGQHTTQSPDGVFYCLTEYNGKYCMATTTDPSGTWSVAEITLPFNADINSLTATTQYLYLADKGGNLYYSTDKGVAWTATGHVVADVIGAYGSQVLASTKVEGTWCVLEYPTEILRPVPDGFPVRNTSQAVSITYEMSLTPQLVITGGRNASGKAINTTWGYDGTGWADITKRPLPYALENLSMAPYFEVKQDTTSWRVDKRTTILVAMNGNNEAGVPNDTVYMSKDFGMHWEKAPANMQVSTKALPSRTHAQIFPFTLTKHAQKAPAVFGSRWQTAVINWADTGYGRRSVRSRATAAITEWEVPYLYLFGGVNADGATLNTVYRGAITSLTLKPLQ